VEEDVLGTERVLSHSNYVPCARCGAMVPRQAAAVVPGDAFEDGSEFQYLCRDCQQAIADGEKDLPTTLV